ncbi:MAG: hypothetical protein J4F43_04725 [Dehalococcoidia bacterium]|nr:hypothetical protein [Dehalococcoidia bacterium]
MAQVLEEMGPAAVSKALSININSLNSWRKRRGLSGRRERTRLSPDQTGQPMPARPSPQT